MKIIVRDNLGKDVTYEREWYINTDGMIFYYTGDIDGPLYVVDNDYTLEVADDVCNAFEEKYNDWQRKYLGKWIGLEPDYPSCCDGCSNNPKNGGSGICNCTLPYMQNPTTYTVSSEASCMANNFSGNVFTVNKSDLDCISKNNHDRIVAAIERTKKYIKE